MVGATSAASIFRAASRWGRTGKVYVADTANNVIRVLTATRRRAAGVTNAASFASRVSPGALASIFGSASVRPRLQGLLGFLTNALPTSLNGDHAYGQRHAGAAALSLARPDQFPDALENRQWARRAYVSRSPAGRECRAGAVADGRARPVHVRRIAADRAEPGFHAERRDPSGRRGQHHRRVPHGSGSGLDHASRRHADSSYSAEQDHAPQIGADRDGGRGTYRSAGLTPGFIGLVQINIVVPPGLAPGTYPLTVTIDGQTSNSGNIVVK